MTATEFRVAPSLQIRGESGVVTLTEVRAIVEEAGGAVTDLVLVGQTTAAQADALQERGWMHLEQARTGARHGGSWLRDAPVQVEARLGTDLLTAAGLLGDDVWDVLAEVRFARVLPLHHEASWYALRFTQADPQVPGVRRGFQTSWVGQARL